MLRKYRRKKRTGDAGQKYNFVSLQFYKFKWETKRGALMNSVKALKYSSCFIQFGIYMEWKGSIRH